MIPNFSEATVNQVVPFDRGALEILEPIMQSLAGMRLKRSDVCPALGVEGTHADNLAISRALAVEGNAED